jgi:hypothetical protein
MEVVGHVGIIVKNASWAFVLFVPAAFWWNTTGLVSQAELASMDKRMLRVVLRMVIAWLATVTSVLTLIRMLVANALEASVWILEIVKKFAVKEQLGMGLWKRRQAAALPADKVVKTAKITL